MDNQNPGTELGNDILTIQMDEPMKTIMKRVDDVCGHLETIPKNVMEIKFMIVKIEDVLAPMQDKRMKREIEMATPILEDKVTYKNEESRRNAIYNAKLADDQYQIDNAKIREYERAIRIFEIAIEALQSRYALFVK